MLLCASNGKTVRFSEQPKDDGGDEVALAESRRGRRPRVQPRHKRGRIKPTSRSRRGVRDIRLAKSEYWSV